MTDISLIIDKITQIVQEEVSTAFQLYLFGSRANDSPDEKADIDIGILSDSPLTAGQMQSIKERVDEIPTLLKIDFIDFASVSDEFKTVALKQAEEIAH